MQPDPYKPAKDYLASILIWSILFILVVAVFGDAIKSWIKHW